MTAQATKIAETIRSLDVENDDLWTQDGLPRIDVVAKASGLSGLTRADLNGAGTGLDRDSLREAAKLAAAPAATPATPVPPVPSTEDDKDAPLANLGDQPDTSLEGPHLELKRARDILEQKRSELIAAQASFDEQSAYVDRLLEEISRAEPLETTMDSIQFYLESQKAQRQAKADAARQLRENGVDLKALGSLTNVRSPLDQAMARKRTR